MANVWDTTALLASIRRRARSTNSSAPGYADSDLLAMANEELASKLAPEMAKLRRDWFEEVRDTTLTVGTATYPLWTRAMVGSARHLGIVSGGVFRDLSYLTPEAMDGKDPTNQASPTHYTIRGTDIVLYPTPNIGDTLRVTYLRRLNRLIATSACLTVTSITGAGSNVYNGAAKPSSITTSTPVDYVKGTPFFDALAEDVTPTGTSGTSITLATSIPGQAVGDYVCLAGEAPVIQGPPEMLAILAQRVANALLRPGRDQAILAAGERELAALEAAVFGVADRRVESDVQTVGSSPWA